MGLSLLAAPVLELRAGLPLIAALPDDSEASRAARAAGVGFVPGVTSPTLVAVAGLRRRAVRRIRPPSGPVAGEPHVAAVLGPREDAAASRVAGRDAGAFLTTDGTTARYLVVLDVDPLDAVAIDAVKNLGRRMPTLVTEAGLPPSTAFGLGGDSVAVAGVIDQTDGDLLRILGAALLVNLVLLMVFLRALVAPLLLVACTALSAAATLGVTVLVFQRQLGHPGVTFFVPLATVVLLLRSAPTTTSSRWDHLGGGQAPVAERRHARGAAELVGRHHHCRRRARGQPGRLRWCRSGSPASCRNPGCGNSARSTRRPDRARARATGPLREAERLGRAPARADAAPGPGRYGLEVEPPG